MAERTKAQRTTLALIVVFVVVVASMIAGVASQVMSTGSSTEIERPVTLAGDSFPAPVDATVSLLPAAGMTPPASTRSWTVTGSLADACAQWRDLFRGWVDQTAQNEVGGSVNEGVSCTFTGKKSGFDAELRLAVYGNAAPEANLTVTDNSAPTAE